MNHTTTLLESSRLAATSLLIFGLACATAAASPAADPSPRYEAISMMDDIAHRSPDIHWPVDFEPAKADLFAHNDLTINASCERVWTYIVDAGRWPTWYPSSKAVHLQEGDSVLRDGAALRKSDETLMHRGHDLWLATLKWVAESK